MEYYLNRELSTEESKIAESHLNVGSGVGVGHATMGTPQSLINQKQTLFQKPDPRKTRSKFKNKTKQNKTKQISTVGHKSLSVS